MIISHKFKLIFIHIYKNGGSFIKKLLLKLDKNAINYTINPHIISKDAKKIIKPHIWKTYRKICVSRNSYDWQVSLFSYMKFTKKHKQYHIIKNMNFHDYVKYLLNLPELHQQIRFILDDNNNILIDNILKFENLNEELKIFFRKYYKIIIDPYLPSKKINASKRKKDYKEYYIDEDKKYLAELHKPDIDYFKFTF